MWVGHLRWRTVSSLEYRPELDGLRSVAVYLVVAFHAHMVLLEGGFVGVDLFFVLSGFLVTGVLLRDLDTRGQIRLGNFYARRVRRLLPAAVVLIVVTCLVQLLVASLPDRIEMIDDARASLLYYANWHFIFEGREYFAQGADSSPFLHFWSLSIEEQFYIVYPLILVLLVRFAARPVRALWFLLGFVTVTSVALQVWIARDDINYAYYSTQTRVYQLAAGAALMLLVRRLAQQPGRRREGGSSLVGARWATPLAVTGLLGIGVTASTLLDATQSNRGLLTTLFAVLAIFGLWWSPRGLASRALGLPVPRYLGQISYGTYLWHWPVVLVLQQVFDVRPLVLTLLTAALATGLAALSFQVFEMPIRKAGWMHAFNWPVVGAALTASVLVFVFVLPGILDIDRRPSISAGDDGSQVGSITAKLDRPVPEDLDLVAAAEDVGPASKYCTPGDTEECVYEEGDGLHVLLIGDSQARMVAPALQKLAREHDLKLSMNIRSACPWQVDQTNERGRASARERCRQDREVFYKEVLERMDVDLVIAFGLSRSDQFWVNRITSQSSPPGETLVQIQTRTTNLTADLVRDAGADLVIIRSILGTDGFGLGGFDPLDCLSAADTLADCAVYPPLQRPAVDSAYETLDVTRDTVGTIDLNPIIRPDLPVCAPVIGKTVVWKDPDHVTTRVLSERSDQIWNQLTATGLVPNLGN